MPSLSSHNSTNDSSSNVVYAYIMVIGVMVTAAGLSEATAIAESKFNYPLIMRYICMATGMLSAIPLLAWKLCSPTTRILKSDKQSYFYAWSFVGSMILTSAGMIFFVSFDGVSVPTATALGGTRAVMVLILSVIIIHEELTLWKIMAVIVSILGILCYVYEADQKGDSNDNGGGVQDTVWGCLLCLLANFMFAFADVVAGKVCKAYDHKVMGGLYYQIFLGLYQLPVFIWVWWWPSTPNTEHRESDWDLIYWCLLPAVALTGNNASIFIGVTIKSPFYVNIGTLLSIPLAFIVDLFIHHYKPTVFPVIGAILLIVSFLMLELIKPPQAMGKWCNYVFINGDDDGDKDEKDEILKDKDNEKEELVQPLIVNEGENSVIKSDLAQTLASLPSVIQ